MAEHPDSDETNEPDELLLAGPDDHGVSRKESERNADVAECNRDLHKLAEIECHTGKSLQDGKLSTTVTPKTEVEEEGSLNVTNELHNVISCDDYRRGALYLPSGYAA